MRVLAIYSSPQEWGDPQLDFVDLEHGQVVQTVSMVNAEYPELEHKEWEEPTGELESHHVGFIHPCEVDKYKVGNRMYHGIIVKSKVVRDELIPEKELYDAHIVVEEYVHKCDYFYNEELDTFDKYLKSIGIHIPWNSPDRQDIRRLIPLIGKALKYDIVNTLYY